LARRGALLERLLRVVGDLCGDRLEALRHRAERLHRHVHVVLSEFLHFVEILEHETSLPGFSPRASVACRTIPGSRPIDVIFISHCTKKSTYFLALQYDGRRPIEQKFINPLA